MTPEQWLAKHYPIPASALSEATDEECLLHGENKWEGAKDKNLPEGARYEWHVIFDDNYYEMIFDADTCALCAKYRALCKNKDGKYCPIIRMQGVPCDSHNKKHINIYEESLNDPAPMIDLLKRTLEFVRNGG